jgi:hypothetical protein
MEPPEKSMHTLICEITGGVFLARSCAPNLKNQTLVFQDLNLLEETMVGISLGANDL